MSSKIAQVLDFQSIKKKMDPLWRPNHYNRTYSLDGQLGRGERWIFIGFCETDTRTNGDDTALHLRRRPTLWSGRTRQVY